MSHVSTIDIVITDEEALKAAFIRIGGKIIQKNTYEWWGHHVGDYPVPKGFKVEDLGKCDWAVHFDGVGYEVGVVKRNDQCHLLWDFYAGGKGLRKVIGDGGGLIKQAYAIEKTKREAIRKKYKVQEKKLDNGSVQLIIQGNF